MNMRSTELVKFRIFSMPCCKHQLCWVNPRLPTFCPECGVQIFGKLRNPEHTVFQDDSAQLKLTTTR